MSRNSPLTAVQLRKWAASLGWTNLKKWTHSVPSPSGKPPFDRITWFESHLSNGAFLQINLLPRPQAAVYAVKFRLFTGWQTLPRRMPASRLTADPLDCLRAAWFKTPASRTQFRTRHPNCTGWTWDRVAREQLGTD